MLPKVSVIIPFFNSEQTIQIPIESLQRQTMENFEVILIDDGSSDQSKEKIFSIINNDARFRYHFHENKGVAAARNSGISLAKGEYISFLDSDDFYEDNFLSEMYKGISLNGADIAYTGHYRVNPSSKKKQHSLFVEKDVLLNYILNRVVVHTTGWIIKKDTIIGNSIEFDEDLSWGEDFTFFCNVLANSDTIVSVNQYLTNYRVNFDKDRLSSFSLDKLDQDYVSVRKLLENERVNSDIRIEEALMFYRLRGVLINRLNLAIDYDVDKSVVYSYYSKYEEIITSPRWNNGLRSLKQQLNKVKLDFRLRL